LPNLFLAGRFGADTIFGGGLVEALMHPSIDQKRSEISHLCLRYGVHRLELFGSAARATDFDPASSDADFLVEFGPSASRDLDLFFGFKSALEALLKRHVDLVEAGAVRNPFLKANIDAAREVVYLACSSSAQTPRT
jgi:predicted nucleotidyltransferase